MKRAACIIACAAMSIMASAVHAVPIILTATLSGVNEVPPNASPATGAATITLDPDAHAIQLNVTFSGLSTNTSAAHIHCCLVPPATTVGVATTVPAFPGFPLGVTSGNYMSAVFDLTQPLIYNPAFVTAQGGLAQAEAALVAGLLAGRTYLNIHTTGFPGGEIRGTLVVPEPATLALLGLGLAGIAVARRRKAH